MIPRGAAQAREALRDPLTELQRSIPVPKATSAEYIIPAPQTTQRCDPQRLVSVTVT